MEKTRTDGNHQNGSGNTRFEDEFLQKANNLKNIETSINKFCEWLMGFYPEKRDAVIKSWLKWIRVVHNNRAELSFIFKPINAFIRGGKEQMATIAQDMVLVIDAVICVISQKRSATEVVKSYLTEWQNDGVYSLKQINQFHSKMLSVSNEAKALSNDAKASQRNKKLEPFLIQFANAWGHPAIFTEKFVSDARTKDATFQCSITFYGIPFEALSNKGSSGKKEAARFNAVNNFWGHLRTCFIPHEVIYNIKDDTIEGFTHLAEVVTLFQQWEIELRNTFPQLLNPSARDKPSVAKAFLAHFRPKAARFWMTRGFTMTAIEKNEGRKRSAEMQSEAMQIDERPSQKVARIEAPEVVSLQKTPPLILIDDDDDDIEDGEIEEIQQTQEQLQRMPSIASTSRPQQNVNQFAELLGVKFYESTFTMTRIHAYRQRYSQQFKEMDEKITAHYLTNRQSPQIYMLKTAALQEMHQVIKPLFPNYTVRMHPVGSTVNGCGSYNSDMDVCISLEGRNGKRGVFEMEKSFTLKSLRQVFRLFKHTNHNMRRCVGDVQLVSSAKVPIIKMELSGEYDGMEVDLNVNSIAGIYNSFLMHYYSRIDERFPELCLLVKHWAIKNDISDAMNGTFNSYSLLLLVVHYLQCGVSPPVLPNLQHLYPQKFAPTHDLDSLRLEEELEPPLPDFEKNTATTGELLCGFFHYYVNFPWDTDAPSIQQGQRISRRFLDQDHDRYYIYIEEPFDGGNTARCVQQMEKFAHIIRVFKQASAVLSTRPPSLANIDVIC
ncbi:unnamed protein product, partial [Mesorhabditis belari]|uniref:PAP-associated domain-containing protein n=1 Tax=Mesorhabditis belari TaxID=2138241 RepID=A0AAF3F1G4_9BILA